ncbi:MAG: hypothetical protein ACPIG6_04960 [Akkermansiaceae bacterium]
MAFAQLITVGAALRAGKMETVVSRAVITPAPHAITGPIKPRSLDEILATEAGSPVLAKSRSPEAASALSNSTQTNATLLTADNSTYQPTTIAVPRVESLLGESRALQMEGDMMRAMLKLDEAARIDPSEAGVLYHKGLLFEEMGLYEKAADQYLQVQQMGIQSGAYFKLAANKLTKGMDVAHAYRPLVSIGPMNVRRASGSMADKQADISITLLARPDKPINPTDVNVQLHFYDKLNGGEIRKALDNAQIGQRWDDRVDWQDPGNEETLNISYRIPEVHLADEHLFGERSFFGFVVELLYKGEIIDQQASPRRLNSIHGNNISPKFNTQWHQRAQNSLLPGKYDLDAAGKPGPLQLPKR